MKCIYRTKYDNMIKSDTLKQVFNCDLTSNFTFSKKLKLNPKWSSCLVRFIILIL